MDKLEAFVREIGWWALPLLPVIVGLAAIRGRKGRGNDEEEQ